jgi:hypothetical protein
MPAMPTVTTMPSPVDDGAAFAAPMPGDYARGQRRFAVDVTRVGSFATGQRRAGAAAIVGTFATGMRSTPTPATVGDFATGMRTVRAPRVIGEEPVGLDTAEALAA